MSTPLSSEFSPETLAQEIAVAQGTLRQMSPPDIMVFVEEVRKTIEEVSSGSYPHATIEFAKNMLLGQCRLRPMTSIDIASFLQGMLGEADQRVPVQFTFVPPAPKFKEYTREQALATLTANPEYITCLMCGKRMQVLSKAHMRKHGLTMEEYRRRFHYEDNDPLVCQTVIETRREAMLERESWKVSPTYIAGKKKKELSEKQALNLPMEDAESMNSDVKVKRGRNKKEAIAQKA